MKGFEQLEGYKSIVLVDLSWNAHRSKHVYTQFTTEINGVTYPTGVQYGLVRSILQYHKAFPGSAVVGLVDGFPQWRGQGSTSYKANREQDTTDRSVHAYLKEAIELFAAIPHTYIAYQPQLEADDLAGVLSKALDDGERLIYLISGDDDYLQLITDGVRIVRHFEKGVPQIIDRDYVVNDERMKEKYHGCEPKYLPLYRALCGDHSDNLPGIPRLDRAIAVKWATNFTSPQDIVERCKVRTPAGARAMASLVEYQTQVERNFMLMKLNNLDGIREDLRDIIIERPAYSELTDCLIITLRMNSLRSAIQNPAPDPNLLSRCLVQVKDIWTKKLRGIK